MSEKWQGGLRSHTCCRYKNGTRRRRAGGEKSTNPLQYAQQKTYTLNIMVSNCLCFTIPLCFIVQ